MDEKNRMSRTLRITLPYMPPQDTWPNRHEGRHWSHRYASKAKMQDDVRVLIMAQGWNSLTSPSVMSKAHITLTFRCPNGGFDLDNAIAAMKGAIDGLKPWVIVDDNATRVSYDLRWERSKRKEVEILVEER